MSNRMLIAVAIVAAAAAAGTYAGRAQSAATTSYTVELDKPSLVKSLDAKPKGPSPGDVTVFSATVRSGGQAAGRLEAVTTAIDPRYQGVSFSMLLDLAGGTIVLQGGGFSAHVPGLTKEGANQLAVTGGTGRYAGTSGTATLRQITRTQQRLTLTLS
jgi:hypothetical protein